MPQLSTTANLVLIAGAGRLSLVGEMPEQPRHVETRRVTPTLVEVDIGPVAGPVETQRWRAPDGVKLIERISMEEAESAGNRLLRARVSLKDSTLSNVRLLGHRLYIDLWSPDTLGARPAVGPPFPGRRNSAAPHKGAPYEDKSVPETRVEPELDYPEIIAPTIARLESVQPFVLAAVAAPSPDVLDALAGTLGSLRQWLETVEPPAASREIHGSLQTAVALAMMSLEPGFTGNRIAKAREAFALVEATKPMLIQNSQTPPTTVAAIAPVIIVAR